MAKNNQIYLFAIPLGLLWPILHLLIFYFRFSRFLENALIESLVFYPMGLLSFLFTSVGYILLDLNILKDY